MDRKLLQMFGVDPYEHLHHEQVKKALKTYLNNRNLWTNDEYHPFDDGADRTLKKKNINPTELWVGMHPTNKRIMAGSYFNQLQILAVSLSLLDREIILELSLGKIDNSSTNGNDWLLSVDRLDDEKFNKLIDYINKVNDSQPN